MGSMRCENSARIFGVGISAFDPSLPGIENRTEDCILETIGGGISITGNIKWKRRKNI